MVLGDNQLLNKNNYIHWNILFLQKELCLFIQISITTAFDCFFVDILTLMHHIFVLLTCLVILSSKKHNINSAAFRYSRLETSVQLYQISYIIFKLFDEIKLLPNFFDIIFVCLSNQFGFSFMDVVILVSYTPINISRFNKLQLKKNIDRQSDNYQLYSF